MVKILLGALVSVCVFFAPIVPTLLVVGIAIFWRTFTEFRKIARTRTNVRWRFRRKSLCDLSSRMTQYNVGVLSFYAMDVLILSKLGSKDFILTRFFALVLILIEVYNVDKNMKQYRKGEGIIQLIKQAAKFLKLVKDSSKEITGAVILMLILGSCVTANNASRKHYTLVQNFPFVHTEDSVKFIDRIKVVTERVAADTVVRNEATHDTIEVVKENLIIRYFNDGKTIYLSGICDTVTIEKEIVRTLPIRYYPTPIPWRKITIWGMVFALSLIAVGYWFGLSNGLKEKK